LVGCVHTFSVVAGQAAVLVPNVESPIGTGGTRRTARHCYASVLLESGVSNYLTSGSIPTRLLRGGAEGMEAGSEGPGLFFRGDPSDIFDVFITG
jgi:hypothetical protein